MWPFRKGWTICLLKISGRHCLTCFEPVRLRSLDWKKTKVKDCQMELRAVSWLQGWRRWEADFTDESSSACESCSRCIILFVILNYNSLSRVNFPPPCLAQQPPHTRRLLRYNWGRRFRGCAANGYLNNSLSLSGRPPSAAYCTRSLFLLIIHFISEIGKLTLGEPFHCHSANLID